MVRTQIQLTERQARELKKMAAREGVSMAVMGKFHSGLKDVSRRHDHYLAEAFDDR
jgi:hypothetical protein